MKINKINNTFNTTISSLFKPTRATPFILPPRKDKILVVCIPLTGSAANLGNISLDVFNKVVKDILKSNTVKYIVVNSDNLENKLISLYREGYRVFVSLTSIEVSAWLNIIQPRIDSGELPQGYMISAVSTTIIEPEVSRANLIRLRPDDNLTTNIIKSMSIIENRTKVCLLYEKGAYGQSIKNKFLTLIDNIITHEIDSSTITQGELFQLLNNDISNGCDSHILALYDSINMVYNYDIPNTHKIYVVEYAYDNYPLEVLDDSNHTYFSYFDYLGISTVFGNGIVNSQATIKSKLDRYASAVDLLWIDACLSGMVLINNGLKSRSYVHEQLQYFSGFSGEIVLNALGDRCNGGYSIAQVDIQNLVEGQTTLKRWREQTFCILRVPVNITVNQVALTYSSLNPPQPPIQYTLNDNLPWTVTFINQLGVKYVFTSSVNFNMFLAFVTDIINVKYLNINIVIPPDLSNQSTSSIVLYSTIKSKSKNKSGSEYDNIMSLVDIYGDTRYIDTSAIILEEDII
jgi:hypothetical protein